MLLGVQPCYFALPMKSRKMLLHEVLVILWLHSPALFMMSLIQTAGHKMTALTFTLCWFLANTMSNLIFLSQIPIHTSSLSAFLSLPPPHSHPPPPPCAPSHLSAFLSLYPPHPPATLIWLCQPPAPPLSSSLILPPSPKGGKTCLLSACFFVGLASLGLKSLWLFCFVCVCVCVFLFIWLFVLLFFLIVSDGRDYQKIEYTILALGNVGLHTETHTLSLSLSLSHTHTHTHTHTHAHSLQ